MINRERGNCGKAWVKQNNNTSFDLNSALKWMKVMKKKSFSPSHVMIIE
jgi:hypothetical protein